MHVEDGLFCQIVYKPVDLDELLVIIRQVAELVQVASHQPNNN